MKYDVDDDAYQWKKYNELYWIAPINFIICDIGEAVFKKPRQNFWGQGDAAENNFRVNHRMIDWHKDREFENKAQKLIM